MRIRIFTTGGTLDKIYFDAKSTYEIGPPNIEKVLAGLSLSIECCVTPLMRKDSLEMTSDDRHLICSEVIGASESRIVITHGTDTMVQTATTLADVSNKTIVLTGALEPALFTTSDATFNIGGALVAAQTLDHGVYIVMNGRVFDYQHVVKDLKKNKFVELE